MLDIIKTKNKVTAFYNGQAFASLNSNTPFNQQVRTIFYLLGQINPSLSRDLVEYELEHAQKVGV